MQLCQHSHNLVFVSYEGVGMYHIDCPLPAGLDLNSRTTANMLAIIMRSAAMGTFTEAVRSLHSLSFPCVWTTLGHQILLI